MDLKPNELVKISKNDKVVSKYMEEVKKINEDVRFVHFMSEEEDRRKMENTRIAIAKEEGRSIGLEEKSIEIAINLLKENMDINIISKTTGLSVDAIKKLERNLN